MNLIKKENEGKILIERIKKNHRAIYEKLYNEEKQLILECIMENKQEDLIKKVNVSIALAHYEGRFAKYHEEEIKKIINENLLFDNLNNEYELYNKKRNLIENSDKMSYEEIITYEYDEDKIEYEKDFTLMKKVLSSVKNLYLYGNAGNGKTTFAYNIAKDLELNLYNINSVKNEYSVKGFFDLDGKYQKSLYEKWYENGGVLLLDEVDSYSSNGMLYLNNGIEVNSKYLTLENGDIIEKNKNCYVIACANTNGEGKTSEYIGRNAIDKAFMSRFTKKEYKEYAYIHKSILGEKDYKAFKKYFDKNDIELTTRLSVKVKQLLNTFTNKELIDLLDRKEIEI